MKINDISVLITGGCGGIGRATAAMFLERGAAKVGLLDIDTERVNQVVAELSEKYSADRVVGLPADLADPASILKAFELFDKFAGKLDVLVNNAGLLLQGPLFSVSFKGIKKFSLEEWHKAIDVNLTAVFICSQLSVERMVKKRIKGAIVNISSFSRNGFAGQSAYSAAKGGIASLTATLSKELSVYGIRCCAIAPGVIETQMTTSIDETFVSKILENVALKRLGTPEEIAHGIQFCVENDYFNGKVLEIDGGMAF